MRRTAVHFILLATTAGTLFAGLQRLTAAEMQEPPTPDASRNVARGDAPLPVTLRELAQASEAHRPDPTAGEEVAQSLSGDALARAWLTAFLSRTNRDDTRWLAAVSALSSREVVEELSAAGPAAVGLESLTSWQIRRIDPIATQDATLDTPTRQVLAYAATVTDGTRTQQKPFVLYSYLEPDGRWRVAQVEQPYSSEG